MKHYRSFIAVMLVLLLGLAACGTDTGGSGKVTVNWWHIAGSDPMKSLFSKWAKDYMSTHSNVDIKITLVENDAFKTKLTAAMQAGNPPDIFQSWGGGVLDAYASQGLMKDITSDLQGAWGDSFSKGALDVYKAQSDGKYYGVPWDMGGVGFWYNKKIFADNGITPPATWDDLLAVVKKLQSKNILPIAVSGKAGSTWTMAFWWEYLAVRIGGKAAFEKAYKASSFDDPTFVNAGKTLKQLIDLNPFGNGVMGQDYTAQQVLMGNSKAAMELMGQWAPANDASNADDKKGPELGFFPFPTVAGGAGAPGDVLGGGNGFGIGKNAPKEAIDFVKFMTSVENQKAMATANGGLPPVKDATSAISSDALKSVADAVSKAQYYQLYYDQYMSANVGNVINDQVGQLFAKAKTPEEVAKAIADAAKAEK